MERKEFLKYSTLSAGGIMATGFGSEKSFVFKKYFLLAGIFCMFLWNANAQNQQTQLKQTLASTSEEMAKDNSAVWVLW
jgi:hypothetical protein